MKIRKQLLKIIDFSDPNMQRIIATFIFIELMVVFLVGQEILAMNYAFEGSANRTGLKACIGIQLLVLFLIAQYPQGIEKTRLLRGQLFFGLIVLVWMFLELSVDTSFRGFSYNSTIGRIIEFFK